jgi:tRNA pseudouridine38-40 synthase
MAQAHHYRVVLAYDGTDFAGWQAQASSAGGRTVQGVLEAALLRLEGAAPGSDARVPVVAASRTDAGVHALGQVACFRLRRDLAPEAVARALNGLLPADVRVVAADHAAEDFHARRSAVGKLYRYVLDTGPVQVPTRRRYAGHAPGTLDEAAVRAAALLYLGRRDFASLQSSGSSVKTTVRTITRSSCAFDAGTLTYEVEADGFLRKMVRSLVGGLVAAGSGVSSVDDLRRALEARDRRGWPAPAPACGLTLVRIDYPESAPAVLP